MDAPATSQGSSSELLRHVLQQLPDDASWQTLGVVVHSAITYRSVAPDVRNTILQRDAYSACNYYILLPSGPSARVHIVIALLLVH